MRLLYSTVQCVGWTQLVAGAGGSGVLYRSLYTHHGPGHWHQGLQSSRLISSYYLFTSPQNNIWHIISGHFISESSRGATSVSAYVRFGHFTKTVRGKFMFLHTFRGLFYIIPVATISLLSVYSVDCTDEPINQCSGPPIPGGCIFLPQIRHWQGRG